jgi:hypothetical protein
MAISLRFRAVLLALLLCLVPVAPAISLTVDEQRLVGFLSGAEIKATVGVLCCDQFAGRKAGEPGQTLAGRYIAGRFSALGMDRVAGSYVEDLTMRYTLVKSQDEIAATMSYRNGTRDARKTFAYPDYYGRGGVKVKSRVVFVGQGSADSDRDDYTGLDVKGKIVVCWSGGDGGALLHEASAISRAANAYRHGAAACLIVGLKTEIHQECGGFGLAGPIADFPCLSIRPEMARSLFPGAWDRLVPGTPGSSPARVGSEVTISVPAIYNPEQRTQNILCSLPGEDPKSDLVLLGAHYDHLGLCDKGGTYCGADDNASGAAVMVEVARAFAKSGLKPKRGIVFAAWTGEEAGLVGSNYFVKSPPFPLVRLKAALNMDMVGVGTRGSYMSVGQTAYPQQFKSLSASARELGLTLLPKESPGVSDHLAFSRKGIPSLLIYSAGEHPNYHTTRDRAELTDAVILENTAKLAAVTIWRLANE